MHQPRRLCPKCINIRSANFLMFLPRAFNSRQSAMCVCVWVRPSVRPSSLTHSLTQREVSASLEGSAVALAEMTAEAAAGELQHPLGRHRLHLGEKHRRGEIPARVRARVRRCPRTALRGNVGFRTGDRYRGFGFHVSNRAGSRSAGCHPRTLVARAKGGRDFRSLFPRLLPKTRPTALPASEKGPLHRVRTTRRLRNLTLPGPI